jgi:hypothetical protein
MNRYLILLAVSVLPISVANAQVFSSTLDDAAGWGIQADEDTSHEFGFDYSPFGIPPAPNGTGTTGLKMSANITGGGGGTTISAYPEGLALSGQYQMQVDFWLNFNSSGGTTEAGGGSVGFDPANGTINGASFLGNTDGDASRDYQLFADGVELRVNEDDPDNDAYTISSQSNSAADLVAQFPGQTTPEAQGAAPFDPTNAIVTAPDGTLGYGWHTLTVDVDTDAGTAVFSLDDGFEIGSVTGADLSGGLALTFQDPFNSVSNKPEFSFGVFDNLTVNKCRSPHQARCC